MALAFVYCELRHHFWQETEIEICNVSFVTLEVWVPFEKPVEFFPSGLKFEQYILAVLVILFFDFNCYRV